MGGSTDPRMWLLALIVLLRDTQAMTTICLDCRYIRATPSGIGRGVQALVDHLPRLAPDIHFRFLRHATFPGPLSTAANVTETQVGFETNGPTSMWLLSQAIDLRDVDLFHAPSNILPRGLSMPSITTIHDLMWLDSPHLCNPRGWGRIERRFYRHGIRRALRRSSAILVPSDATRAAILAKDAALEDRTFTIRPGVGEPFRARPVDRARLAEWGLADRPYVLTVGQFAPYKNHENALRGFARALSDRTEIALALVQRRGPSRGTLDALASDLGIADRVKFLPPLDEPDLAQLYNGAMALLHPSLCEGFGIPLVEAMACGCPVVTSNISAMPEVVGAAALLVDPQDPGSIAAALRKLADDPDLASDLRQQGLRRMQTMDWESYARAHLSAYRRVLAGL